MAVVIGLTGNSGCGKSTVASIMAKYGALVLDCDKIAHENMEPTGCAYSEIVDFFGKEILNADSTINRRALGNIVFNDSEKLKALNKITHEKIAQAVKQRIAQADCKCVVVDAPLLIEAGLDEICDKVWVVTADEEVRVNRIMARDGISRQQVLARFSKQTPSNVLREKADLIIDHSENDFEKLDRVVYNCMVRAGVMPLPFIALKKLSQEAEANGISNMTLEEINAEIKACRDEQGC